MSNNIKHTIVVLPLLFVAVFAAGCASVQEGIFDLAMEMERDRAGLELKSVGVGGRSYSYLEREGAGDAVVLLHGFTANKDNWVRFVRYLPEIYRVLVIDMPGHGDNPRDMAGDYSPEALAKGVARVMEALRLEQVHIAGASLGGLASKLYALDHPDKVKSIGLFNSAGVVSPTRSEFQVLLETGDNLFEIESREDFDRLGEYVFHEPPFLPWPIRSVTAREYIRRNPFYLKMLDDIKDPESTVPAAITEKLAHLSMPTLVLWGDNDRVLHVSSVEVYKRHLPNYRIVIMENCGHAPMLERPEESAAHYARFLEEVADRP